ncbi:MAG: hypothetical protein ACLQNE_28895 [Thermoguttaceae bacterium]
MGFGQRWPERVRRPKARHLAEGEKDEILATLRKAIAASPVLSSFGVEVQASRGRFYIERQREDEDSSPYMEEWGRITPLAGEKNELLLEAKGRRGGWFEVARGSARGLIGVITNDREGTFHGLGALDKSLRRSGKGPSRLRVKRRGKTGFVYADTGKECGVQEALFHYFGIPVAIVAEPSDWYRYHREPKIVEVGKGRAAALVLFTGESWSGETFGGTCLYFNRDGQWGA